jgi:hypothetical protein
MGWAYCTRFSAGFGFWARVGREARRRAARGRSFISFVEESKLGR